MPKRGPLTLCSATLLPDFVDHPPDSIFRQLDAARAAGFSGISLWSQFYDAARGGGYSSTEIRAAIDAAGLAIPMVEAVMPWEAQDESEALAHAEPCFALARDLGARHVVAVTMSATALDPEFAAARFARLCDLAADYGVGPMIEFLPWSGIPDLASAWRIVDAADRANGGLMIDTWHWQRQPGGPDLARLRQIPGSRIRVVQLCDSAPGIDGGSLEEAMTDRRLPGTGNVDFTAFFRVLDEIGAEPILAPEVFSRDLTRLGMEAMANEVHTACRSLLDAIA